MICGSRRYDPKYDSELAPLSDKECYGIVSSPREHGILFCGGLRPEASKRAVEAWS
jgi:hypothetical protein